MVDESRLNNFDLIRLAAAGQVVLWHGIEHLHVPVPGPALWLLGSFPGVPIFFVVSGYLVSQSFHRRRSTANYFVNRALRIFPALWLCFVVTAASIFWTHGFANAGISDLLKWMLPNLLGFAHTPWFLKTFATGSVNGSLWTIPVELQFYLALPLLALFLQRNAVRWTAAFAVALVCGLIYLAWGQSAQAGQWANALSRALPSWLYLFMAGMVLQWRSDWVERWIEGRFFAWLTGFLAWILLLDAVGINTVGNRASPLALLPLAGLVLAAAFSYRHLAHRLLRGHDVSYGIYLYHMPVINVLVAGAFGLDAGTLLIITLGSTLALAAISWWTVERSALALKPSWRPSTRAATG
jgi:peptidoglycan/LPS O-acetylase OafA/YrhL